MKYQSKFFGGENIENSFWTISTQLKFLPFMIFWIFNSIYIWIIWICGRRMITNLLYTCLIEMVEYGYFHRDLTSKEIKQKKDDRFNTVLTYSAMTTGLLLFYYLENPVMNFLIRTRLRLASTYFGFENYWLPLIFLIAITVYFVHSAIKLYDLDEAKD
jgi:hypothetical protein